MNSNFTFFDDLQKDLTNFFSPNPNSTTRPPEEKTEVR
jgi:hypothetical protein